MLKKQDFKFQALSAACLLFLAEGVYADSAANSQVLVTPGPATPNQMYLLDSGYVDYASFGLGSTNNLSSWVCSATHTVGCIGSTNNKGVCPKGFVPYILMTPSKQADMQTATSPGSVGASNICTSLFEGGGASSQGYSFLVLTSAISSQGQLSGTGVAFNWNIFCIPGSYSPAVPGPNKWLYSNFTTGTCSDTSPQFCQGNGASSGCTLTTMAPQTSYDKQPIIWETGTFNTTGLPLGNLWVTTTRTCPSGYSPSIELLPYKGYVSNAGQNWEASKFSVCPYASTLDNPPNNFKLQPPPATGGYAIKFNASTQNSLSNLGIKWTISCYPSGVTPPGLDTACALPGQTEQKWTGVFPFGQAGGPVTYNAASFFYAQIYKPGTNDWTFSFAGNKYSSQPYWNTYFEVPFSGTYMLTLSLTIYNTDSNSACQLGLYLSPPGLAFTIPLVTVDRERIPIAPAIWPNVGVTRISDVINSIYLTGGQTYSVYGVQWNATCSALYISSDGSLTATRTGP